MKLQTADTKLQPADAVPNTAAAFGAQPGCVLAVHWLLLEGKDHCEPL